MTETVRLTLPKDQADRYLADLAEREKKLRAERFPGTMKPEELLNLSAKFCQARKYDDCLAAALRAVELRPGYAEAYNNMAAAYLSMDRWDDGIEAAQQALKFKPNYEGAKSNLAWGLKQKTEGK